MFEDLDGNPVEPNSRPAGKVYAVDPDRLMDPAWVRCVLTPEPYEVIVRTDSLLLEEIAAHSGAFSSKSEARRAGFAGSPHHGLELYGPLARTFWIWCPVKPEIPPVFSRKKLRTPQWWEFLQSMGWVNKTG